MNDVKVKVTTGPHAGQIFQIDPNCRVLNIALFHEPVMWGHHLSLSAEEIAQPKIRTCQYLVGEFSAWYIGDAA